MDHTETVLPTPQPQADEPWAELESTLHHLETLQDQLEGIRSQLSQQQRLISLGTIASSIAHEFNNLLTPAIAYCQLAIRQDTQDIPMMRKALHTAQNNAERAAQIATSLLGFARHREEKPVSYVPDVVNEVFNCLARPPQKDNYTLDINVARDCWAAIQPVQLQQILLNLVLNARTVLRGTGGHLIIEADCPEDAPEMWIRVADTGPGIPPDQLEHIFEPFVSYKRVRTAGNANSTATSNPGGTGLGLTICKQLIEEAQGSIHVQSTVNVGTAFTLVMPKADEPITMSS